MDSPTARYRGRFAPSPTGPLHAGSLVAAVASRCEALRRNGEWLVRMEDLDAPRCIAGAADTILSTLDALGFAWDGPVLYQSRRSEAYAAALARLGDGGHTFACACSRREVADSGLAPDGEPIYPGTCRRGLAPGRMARATRVRVDDAPIEFMDAVQGPQREHLSRSVGDFVLKRADGFFAYQLAVVVDDADQQVTHVVRGADLLGSTARQVWLQRLLCLPAPAYAHVPVMTDAAGQKLSKQSLASPVDAARPARQLVRSLRFLGQDPPVALERAGVAEVWSWAREHWSLDRVPRVRSATEPAP